ncbi:crossover junction endodeoxyribonuclease RuvC [bacterium BMS3Abin03]|nr:crossover junction endodeoxyribonuclease RuvC [bacterium BMS3Abin03]HDZ58826.1 crossover junction endodeoxyribonuclease RuvC [Ignavibacteriales bacterium]
MIIIGVDPGTNITGFGIIKFEKNNYYRIASGVIKLPSQKPIPQRLKTIYSEINKLIKTYKPDEFAIETAFYGKNVQSAMKIGYARGVSILAAVHNGIPTSEYSPREIKKSVVGRGSASKEQVGFMIKSLLVIDQQNMKTDESDALAIALCHAFRMKNPGKKSMNWKQFTETFPERIIS